MAKKNHFILIDTETTQDSLVADFGAAICDSKGQVISQCGVLTDKIFNDTENHPLFFTSDSDGIWSKKGQDRRYAMYQRMMESGSRMLASVAAINRWLDKAKAQFDPILTAYNLPFDVDKCKKTGIDLTMFDRRFCLWDAAYTQWAFTKQYRQMVLSTHAFNAPTDHGNMTFKTNAETMARFCLNNPGLQDEPHTALEDVIEYELPILVQLLKRRSAKWLLSDTQRYSWRECQVNKWFKA